MQCHWFGATAGPRPHWSCLGEMLSDGTSFVPITPLISPKRISLLAWPGVPRMPISVSWFAPGFCPSWRVMNTIARTYRRFVPSGSGSVICAGFCPPVKRTDCVPVKARVLSINAEALPDGLFWLATQATKKSQFGGDSPTAPASKSSKKNASPGGAGSGLSGAGAPGTGSAGAAGRALPPPAAAVIDEPPVPMSGVAAGGALLPGAAAGSVLPEIGAPLAWPGSLGFVAPGLPADGLTAGATGAAPLPAGTLAGALAGGGEAGPPNSGTPSAPGSELQPKPTSNASEPTHTTRHERRRR